MNILYIGPYRDGGVNGEISRQYILDLNSKHSLYTKPYRLDEDLYSNISDDITRLEKPTKKSYDYCIQHLPIDRLGYSGFFRNNIAIPIFLGYSNITNQNIVQNLNRFNKIIVNNDSEISLLLRSDVKTPIIKTDIDLSDIIKRLQDKKFNFGAHNYNHKFYGFFNYKKEHDIIKKILLAFYVAFRCRDGQSIVLSIKGDHNDQKDLTAFIQQTKKELNINSSNKSLVELFLFTPMNIEEQIALHNTCETLLCFSRNNTILHKTIAQNVNNNIIDDDNTVVVNVPCYSTINGGYLPDDTNSSILTESLINNFRAFLSTHPEEHRKQNYTTISKLI